MDTKKMVMMGLSNEMIRAGASLLEKLQSKGIHPDAAFWLYAPEIQDWRLRIAEASVVAQGPRGLYKKIQKLLSLAEDEVSDISLDHVVLVSPDDPLVTALKKALRAAPDSEGIRLTNSAINGVPIEDAYVYRLHRKK